MTDRPEVSPPDHWEELTPEQRIAIVEMAKDRIFWKSLYSKLWWLKGAATILLTLSAATVLLKDSIVDLLHSWTPNR